MTSTRRYSGVRRMHDSANEMIAHMKVDAEFKRLLASDGHPLLRQSRWRRGLDRS